jgi:hypothetical protein
MDSPSQEIHCERSWLDLDHGREQRTPGQWEEAQSRSSVMMIIHLHEGEGFLPSRTLQEWQILQPQRE